MTPVDDVVVVGGGPAGAFGALLLARQGWRVRVFDRARFPRAKLCGDTLNPGACAVLGAHVDLGPLRTRGEALRGMRLSGPGGVLVSVPYRDGVEGIAVTRAVLDAWLVEEAARAGAVVEDGVAVRAPLMDDGRVCGVRVTTAGGARPHRARLVLGADGRRSVLASAAGAASTPRNPRRWAFGAYYEGVADVAPGIGEMHIRAGRYVGLAPVPGGLTNVCLVVAESAARVLARGGPASLLESVAADRWLAPRVANARLASAPASLGPMAVDVSTVVAPGLLLAGDAAGFIDPMTGDGLRLAFSGAELAAAVAGEVLRGTLAPERAAVALGARRRGVLGAKWRFNRILRAAVDVEAVVTAAAIGARLAPRALWPLVHYAGDAHLVCG